LHLWLDTNLSSHQKHNSLALLPSNFLFFTDLVGFKLGLYGGYGLGFGSKLFCGYLRLMAANGCGIL